MKEKIGLLLVNVGSPNSTQVRDVRRYLKQFLSNPRVLNVAAPLRYFLLYALILPFRPKKSAEAYRAIWTDKGSPLIVYMNSLKENLQSLLPKRFIVEVGMGVGNPSIPSAIDKLLEQKIEHLLILPMFPQYSYATTGAVMEDIFKALSPKAFIPSIQSMPAFYNEDFFIKPYARIIQTHIEKENPEHLLMSYHGLPQTTPYVELYKEQCENTSKILAQKLGFEANFYSLSFQSRLGKTPWIKPYTDHVLPELYNKGIKRLAMVCPSFTTDCLETLEEIGIRAQEQWKSLGGTHFALIPCVNAEKDFSEQLSAHLQGLVP